MQAIYSSLQRGVRADTRLHSDWIVLEINVSVLLVWPSCRTKQSCISYSDGRHTGILNILAGVYYRFHKLIQYIQRFFSDCNKKLN